MTNPTIALVEFLRKIGMHQDKDFLAESVRVMSQTPTAAGSAETYRCGETRTDTGPDELPEWIPGARLGRACRRDQSAYSKAESRNLLSKPPGTPQACGESLVGGGAASVCGRGLDPQGG